VQDGDTLYVDRNGNGDLTEDAERIAAKKNARAGDVPGVYEFEVGDIADGLRVHKDLRCAIMTIGHIAPYDGGVKTFLKEHPQGRGFVVSCEAEVPDRKGAGTDGRILQIAGPFDLIGLLQFAEKPTDAPIIHFGGPWQVSLFHRHELKIGRQKEISLTVGTPGLGPGTTAHVTYEELIPKDVYPRVEIAFPPAREGSLSVRQSYELKMRGCGINFTDLVRIPANVGPGLADVTINFDAWTDGQIAPSRHLVDLSIPPASRFPIEDVSSRLKGALMHPGRYSSMTTGMCFSPNGARLVAGDYDTGVIQVWEVDSGRQLAMIDTGKRQNHYEFVVSPDWKTVYAPHVIRKATRSRKDGKPLTRWDFEGGIRAWNLETGELLETYQPTPARGIRGISLSPDGKFLLTTEDLPGEYERGPPTDNSLFDLGSGEFRPLDRGRAGPGSFSKDSRTISFVDMDDDYSSTAISLFDVATGKTTRSFPLPDKSTRVSSTELSPNGRLLVSSEQLLAQKSAPQARSVLKFRDPESGAELTSLSAGRAQFSPDGRALAAIGEGPLKLYVFDVQRMEPRHTVVLTENATVRRPEFSPDGKWIAVLTQILPTEKPQSEELNPEEFSQPRIFLVETVTGKIRETLVGPQDLAMEIRFSPDGKTLAMSGIGRVLLWDLEGLGASM
jgi:WD40 repeat protein